MTKRLVALLGATVIVLGACSPAASPAASGPAGSGGPAATTAGGLAADQTLRIYCCAEDPRSLEAQGSSGSDEISIEGGIYRGLLYYNPDLTLRPEMAEALPEISADGLTYTYKLKAGLKYANGDPIVAGDFVRAAQHLADPRNAFDYGYEMCWLTGADKALGVDFGCNTEERAPYTDVAACDADPTKCAFDDATVEGLLKNLGAEAPDDTTVIYHLAQPVVFWPNITAMWLMTPVPESATSYAEAADIGPHSSGPFMMSEWTHNSEIVLVPNPNWAGTKPTLTKISIRMGGDPEAALAAYESGDYDMVVVPGTSTLRVADDPALSAEIKDTPQLAITYFDFQTCQVVGHGCPTNEATKDKRSPASYRNFRIALTEATDKQELIDQTFGALGTVANGSVMPGIPGWPDDYNPYPFNIEKAKEDLNKAMDDMGIPAVAPLPATTSPACDDACQLEAARVERVHKIGRMKFGYNCNAGHETRVFYLYDAWRNNLGFAGSQFDISCTDFGTFRTERRAGNVYDIQRNGWGADFPHPDNQLRDLFATGAGNNNNGYSNKAFDDLLNKAAAESDETKSNDLYKEAQRLLVDDAAVLFMRYGITRNLVKPYVAGLVSVANDHQNYGDVFYETISILAQ
jgi:oligopeptide transport system substrate-binding protein